MHGTGLPLVTPFDENENIDEAALREVVEWVVSKGVDFIVPCGSNSEAELMTLEERNKAVRIVEETASVPVMAGVGHPGLVETSKQLNKAADAGVDAGLVVTPFYYTHDQDTLKEYYIDLADESDVPIYLYSVPAFTNTVLSPETVQTLSQHNDIRGIKDSSGDIQNIQRLIRHTDSDFDVLVGSGGVYAQALEVGASGGVMALANVAPGKVDKIHEQISDGSEQDGKQLNKELVELNHAITSKHGVPGLKSAMRSRELPAGRVRRPFQPVSDQTEEYLSSLVDEAI